MNTISTYKEDYYRRLSIQKDLRELDYWILTLEDFNDELDDLNIIEKQLIANGSISNAIRSLRRKNVLNMAELCKYDRELRNEYEDGYTDYDQTRLKVHERKREQYIRLTKEFGAFRKHIYKFLMRYQLK
ncbi:hypothetical protein Q4566_03500 [Tamlana sp. 2_MG-2023]|uniref:hypothetical protein n=1 Tax=unclassified Tamlana TaxID=2614803 RepID=UPI0026E3B154|nr:MULTISPECIES: hypothetical protein [unclassified Tamlana]MDO6759252.1 hypothetical protein [Tamlana sp. 2_MG-2023]MDO6790609.1 hypothetical protein [Tamlana sp. 1_MG-2023]